MDSSTVANDVAGAKGGTPAFARPDSVANDTVPFLLMDATTLAPEEIEQPFGYELSRTTGRAEERFRRCCDVTLAIVFLVFLSPLMLVCAVASLCSGPGPLLFRHVRIGLGGREFECLKFRTMTHSAEHGLDGVLLGCVESREQWAKLHKLRQDPRTTRVGRFMRRYSLDELPQLINVLRGDMSIVGPRPIVQAEIVRYGASFVHYCSVKPGLTGLWQVSGRHALSYEERVMLDTRYATTRSPLGDLLILLRTVPVVIMGQNE